MENSGMARSNGLETSTFSRLPKKPLLSCVVDGVAMQKLPSPKKKALDPLRYIPSERTSFFCVFTVLARFEEHDGEVRVQRTYPQFLKLHAKIHKMFPRSTLPKHVPSVSKKRHDDEYLQEKRTEMNEYLKQLMDVPEIRLCRILREFVEDTQVSDDSDDDDELPSKALEGLPGTIVTVRAGQSFSVSLNMQHTGDVASWQFKTKKHNIGFSASFNALSVRVYSREESSVKPVKGSFKCTEPGTLTLNWDNTYTWSKAKVLVYWAELESTQPKPSTNTQGKAKSGDTSSLMDGRRAGYIAQSRNPVLYPRQIVNSSLSLITKPFISSGKSNQAGFKSGLLIVERQIKFRGRRWYRKWFTLDMHKGILRYYDSEAAARKGLSLAKLNLSRKNACLAITSSNEAAPTPYLFMVRARKRCWKMCASTRSEYHEWEHAISTAILAAQVKRRRDQADPVDPNELATRTNPEEPHEDDSEDSDDDEGKDDEESEEVDSDHSPCVEVPPNLVSIFPDSESPSRPEEWKESNKHITLVIKKALMLLGLNGFVYSLRSSDLFVLIPMLVAMNGLLLVYYYEQSTSTTPTKDKEV
ncbi:hypothetical protein Poli38472_012988 [Pythium oligandrum]|uniref:PX domain-containing protein n=1 Tax=Pythium oligandrum TaxID=41045 RepID=A0A8K1FIZ2_PYTOL|nr:hypothetical protein Poli38472_012988 [Pythium oligandrum]|eukprot:TMW64366.1 hypothetical protein Poli38472_012988 [Pythium oligandrum]